MMLDHVSVETSLTKVDLRPTWPPVEAKMARDISNERPDPRGESVYSWQLTKKPRLNMGAVQGQSRRR